MIRARLPSGPAAWLSARTSDFGYHYVAWFHVRDLLANLNNFGQAFVSRNQVGAALRRGAKVECSQFAIRSAQARLKDPEFDF